MLNGLNQIIIAVFDVGNVKLLIKGYWSEDSRKSIHLKSLILRGIGIIKSPLLKRNIFADEEK